MHSAHPMEGEVDQLTRVSMHQHSPWRRLISYPECPCEHSAHPEEEGEVDQSSCECPCGYSAHPTEEGEVDQLT